MAIKKSELYSSLWASCDKLRGSMEPSQYKDYVLVLLFVKYVSDKYANEKQTVYDSTCGSASLLLKIAEEAETKVSAQLQRMGFVWK